MPPTPVSCGFAGIRRRIRDRVPQNVQPIGLPRRRGGPDTGARSRPGERRLETTAGRDGRAVTGDRGRRSRWVPRPGGGGASRAGAQTFRRARRRRDPTRQEESDGISWTDYELTRERPLGSWGTSPKRIAGCGGADEVRAADHDQKHAAKRDGRRPSGAPGGLGGRPPKETGPRGRRTKSTDHTGLNVELWGFEPQTSSMPWRRATSCAIAPGMPDGSPARRWNNCTGDREWVATSGPVDGRAMACFGPNTLEWCPNQS